MNIRDATWNTFQNWIGQVTVLANSCQLWKLSVPVLFPPSLCFCVFVEIIFEKFGPSAGCIDFLCFFLGFHVPIVVRCLIFWFYEIVLFFKVMYLGSCNLKIFSKNRIKHVTALLSKCGSFRFEWFPNHLRVSVIFQSLFLKKVESSAGRSVFLENRLGLFVVTGLRCWFFRF